MHHIILGVYISNETILQKSCMPVWLLDMPATESITVYTITVFITSLNGVTTCMTSRKNSIGGGGGKLVQSWN